MISNATVLIADQLRIEVNGKLFVIGMYTGNVAVPEGEEETRGSLQFLFSIDCKIDEIPKEIVFEASLPGEELNRSIVQVPPFVPEEQHTQWMMRHAVAATNQVLRPGKIVAKVIADGQETVVGTPWIVAISAEMMIRLNTPPGLTVDPTVFRPPSSQSQPDAPD